ncbi:MAG: hypothetical protein HC903_11540 [Methylacidiphilales bacterium]|nr:hypothetical protein [Candidatus Methylacidiphilales bacterium]NJR15508.1 hypothetical protein [Calothrix sp. CSU_2_0]
MISVAIVKVAIPIYISYCGENFGVESWFTVYAIASLYGSIADFQIGIGKAGDSIPNPNNTRITHVSTLINVLFLLKFKFEDFCVKTLHRKYDRSICYTCWN